MKFTAWNEATEEANANRASVQALLLTPDIWEPQRIDTVTLEEASKCKFVEGSFVAVFYEDLAAVGYVLFTPKAPGVWDQHTGFDTKHRGSFAALAVKQAHTAMFMQTPAFQIISFCPEWNPATSHFAQMLGATKAFRHVNAYTRDGKQHYADCWTLPIATWAYQVHHEYKHVGAKWHEDVFEKLEPHHEDDPAHNGFLGLAVTMAQFDPAKAVALYNAYAQLSGYQPANLIYTRPGGVCVIDIGNAVVTMRGDQVSSAVSYPCQPLESSPQ